MPTERDIQFVKLLTDSQSRLYAYLMSLLANTELATEVLQETNVVLLRKSDEFEMGSNFTAWAMAVARYQVMSTRQKYARERLVFDDELIDTLTRDTLEDGDRMEEELHAVSRCLEELPEDHRSMIRGRYYDAKPVAELAKELAAPHEMFTTKIAALHFSADHEMLHAGQIGVLRRMLGKEPVR